jgi:hypothetical protein
MATKKKEGKDDNKVKRQQAADAIRRADIESEMLSKRDDRPVAVARPVVPVARPAVARPAVAPTASNPAMDEMRNADLQRPMANKLSSAFKSGGSVKSKIDGIAQRGKTRGRIC